MMKKKLHLYLLGIFGLIFSLSSAQNISITANGNAVPHDTLLFNENNHTDFGIFKGESPYSTNVDLQYTFNVNNTGTVDLVIDSIVLKHFTQAQFFSKQNSPVNSTIVAAANHTSFDIGYSRVHHGIGIVQVIIYSNAVNENEFSFFIKAESQKCTSCDNPKQALPRCTSCDPLFSNYPSCDRCANIRHEGVNCDQCHSTYINYPACDECANDRHTGQFCDSCADRFNPNSYPACNVCASNRQTGANCDQCIVAKADPATNCSTCLNPNQRYPRCH